jgi:hypothetical protein
VGVAVAVQPLSSNPSIQCADEAGAVQRDAGRATQVGHDPVEAGNLAL